MIGARVVVTRAAHQAEGLCAAFRDAGAHVEPLPLLEVHATNPAELRDCENLSRFQWIVFTSTNAVESFLPVLRDRPSELRLAAVGRATAEALQREGFTVDLIPQEHRAEGLVAALGPLLDRGSRVLLPQADDARPTLAEGLRAVGATVETLVAYRKRLPSAAPEAARLLFRDSPLGWVTFTSPRIVRAFVELFGDSWTRRRRTLLAASIGPVTSDALISHGVSPAAQARSPSDSALVSAVVGALPKRG